MKKYLLTNIPISKSTNTVKEVVLMLQNKSKYFESTNCVYIVDNNKNLIGFIPIKDLFASSKSTKIEKVMHKKLVAVPPETEVEKIAHLALKHDLSEIPVVKSKKFVGVIPSRKIISIVNKALREDIFHFAGVHKSHLEFENSLEVPLFKAVKNHSIWLLVGLLGAILMASYIGFFEETLKKYLILAAFMPAIIYMSDALGTQIQTIFVRDLAILGKELNLKKYFFRQMMIAISISLLIGILMFLAISFFWNKSFIGLVISLAAFSSLIVTSFTSFSITLLIKQFKFDPALGSGPVATIISDVTSVIIYFVIVSAMI